MKNIYSIMILDETHIEEICADIKEQYENGIADYALFKMTLVPEGTPPTNKAQILCDKYKKFKEKLDKYNIPNGVLVQATMGHGWTLGAKFPFQHLVGLDGNLNSEIVNTVCPYDEGFREYLYDAFRTIALCKPDHIMVDDDFRLMGRAGGGCGCPLHIGHFNRISGKNFDRETLLSEIRSGSDEGKKHAEIFLETQKDSLLGAAQAIRAGIDSVDDTLPGSFCCVGNNAEFAGEIGKILAGKGNPVIIRLNNGNYTPAGARFFSQHFFRAASQVAKLKDCADVLLAETDTCPQNRYSTGAMSVHTHFTGSILEGAAGGKHWITRLRDYEPESGKAYRKVLSKNRGFYDALAELQPSLSWRGFRINIHSTPEYHPGVAWYMGENYGGWGRCVIERLGLPMFFSPENKGVLCLDGDVNMTDEEITEALKGMVMLASDSAKQLIDRGFGKYLGVDVRKWEGKNPKGELLNINGKKTSVQVGAKQLVITDKSAVADSVVFNTLDDVNLEELFPGSVIFKNSLGGTAITFCGTPDAEFNILQAFSFLSYSRKLQLIKILKAAGELPVYCPGDEEMYFKVADMPDGGLFCAIFNIGLDPIEKAELVFEKPVTRIEKLMPDGSRNEISFEVSDGVYTLDASANTLDPLVIFAY